MDDAYSIDGVESNWIQVVELARKYGFKGERGNFYAYQACEYLRSSGHVIEEP